MRLLLPIALLALAGCAKGEWEAFQARIPNAAAIHNAGTPGVQAYSGGTPPPPQPPRPARFLRHHYVSGMNRICIYDSMGSQEIITIGAAEICPLS